MTRSPENGEDPLRIESNLVRKSMQLVLALVLSLGITGLVVPASPALALCSGTGCNKVDPQSSGCSATASTVSGAEFWGNGLSVVQRRSSGCKARWTRMTIDQFNCCNASLLRIQRQLWSPYGWYDAQIYTKYVGGGALGQFWTPMVGDTSDDRTRSCWGIYPSSTNVWCSGWF